MAHIDIQKVLQGVITDSSFLTCGSDQVIIMEQLSIAPLSDSIEFSGTAAESPLCAIIKGRSLSKTREPIM
jgi:hypothetical protein